MATTSVLIATWNGEKFIKEQLESIGSQTRLPDEIIISDDGSTDNTIEIARCALALGSIPFKIVTSNGRNGSSRNFCNGLSHCKNDLIFFCDQDDIWNANKIEILASTLESNEDISYCFTDAALVNSDLSPIGLNLWESLDIKDTIARYNLASDQMDVLFHQPIVTGATSAFRRIAINSCQPFPPEWIHDRWCSTLLATMLHRGIAIEIPTILYRQHHEQQVGGNGMSALQRWKHIRHTSAKKIEIESLMWEILHSRIDESSIWKQRVIEKISHFRVRSEISKSNFIKSFYLSAHELINRRYQYSDGIYSFIRDIFLPRRNP